MTASRPLSKNAQAQRAFRQRMQERNWKPHQVYILPAHKLVLDAVEAALRQPTLPEPLRHLCQEHLAAMTKPWTTETLYDALNDRAELAGWVPELFKTGDIASIGFTVADLGDLSIHLAAAGTQIVVSTVLFPASSIEDRAAFNDRALRLGPAATLTSIGLQTINGDDVYVAYGSLSALSPLETVVEELQTLARNSIEFATLFSSHIGV